MVSLKRIVISLLAVCLTAGLFAADFQTSADLQLGGGYSEIQGGSGSTAGAGQIMFLPMWKLGSSDFIVPSLYATDSGRSVSFAEGNSLPAYFVQSLILTGEPVWKHIFGDSGWTSGVYGQAIHNYNEGSVGEILGKGLYDNEIYGGGLQLSKKDLTSWLPLLSLDASYNHWSYPNYHNGILPYNYYSEDMNVTKVDLTASLPMSLSLFYSFSDRAYTDDYSYNAYGYLTSNGQLNGPLNPLRDDLVSQLRLGWTHPFNEHWATMLYIEGGYTGSNYNSFDFNANQALPDFFSNRDIAFSPTLSWMPHGDPKGDMISLTWRTQYLEYLHRIALNPDGSVTKGTEDDFENTFSLYGRKVLWGPLSVYGKFVDDAAQSNQGLQATVAYNYNIFDSQLGLEYQY
jgi:hypothetical protein